MDTGFPTFARIAQKALNFNNPIAAEMSELEAGITMAGMADDGWELHILSHVSDLCAPASAYAAHILELVKLYGGGPGAPHLRFLDNVAKKFQCTQQWGENGWRTF